MIQDARVLQDEFIPKEVGHRDQEMNALIRALDPVTRGQSAETAFLFGPSGAGKPVSHDSRSTACAKR